MLRLERKLSKLHGLLEMHSNLISAYAIARSQRKKFSTMRHANKKYYTHILAYNHITKIIRRNY